MLQICLSIIFLAFSWAHQPALQPPFYLAFFRESRFLQRFRADPPSDSDAEPVTDPPTDVAAPDTSTPATIAPPAVIPSSPTNNSPSSASTTPPPTTSPPQVKGDNLLSMLPNANMGPALESLSNTLSALKTSVAVTKGSPQLSSRAGAITPGRVSSDDDSEAIALTSVPAPDYDPVEAPKQPGFSQAASQVLQNPSNNQLSVKLASLDKANAALANAKSSLAGLSPALVKVRKFENWVASNPDFLQQRSKVNGIKK